MYTSGLVAQRALTKALEAKLASDTEEGKEFRETLMRTGNYDIAAAGPHDRFFGIGHTTRVAFNKFDRKR